MADKKKENKFIGFIVRIIMLICAIPLILCYLSIFINPDKAWFMTIFGLLFIPLFLLNVIMLFWGLIRRKSYVLIPFIALIPGFFLLGRFFQPVNSAEPEKGNVKLVTYNVGKFLYSPTGSTPKGVRECRDSLFTYLKQCDADIICLQEFWMRNQDHVKEYLKQEFPDYEAEYYLNIESDGANGNVILTRYDVLDKGVVEFGEESSNMVLYTDMRVHGVNLRLYNCHLESYSVSLNKFFAHKFVNDTTFARQTEEKVKNTISKRTRQVDQMVEDIENSPFESIIVGDFNDGPMSYTYHCLSKGKNDTFVKSGRGPGATYRKIWPMLRIDFVLYPKRYKCKSHEVIKLKYSDHYPVITQLDI